MNNLVGIGVVDTDQGIVSRCLHQPLINGKWADGRGHIAAIGTVADVCERDPGVGLEDGRGVLGPGGEVVGVLRDVVLHALDYRLGFEGEDGSQGGFEQVETTNGTFDSFAVTALGLDSGGERGGDGLVPVVVVLSAEEDDDMESNEEVDSRKWRGGCGSGQRRGWKGFWRACM